MENPETPYLDNLGVRKEFFLRLEQRFDKVGQDGAPYSVHKMIDRPVSYTHLTLPTIYSV